MKAVLLILASFCFLSVVSCGHMGGHYHHGEGKHQCKHHRKGGKGKHKKGHQCKHKHKKGHKCDHKKEH